MKQVIKLRIRSRQSHIDAIVTVRAEVKCMRGLTRTEQNKLRDTAASNLMEALVGLPFMNTQISDVKQD